MAPPGTRELARGGDGVAAIAGTVGGRTSNGTVTTIELGLELLEELGGAEVVVLVVASLGGATVSSQTEQTTTPSDSHTLSIISWLVHISSNHISNSWPSLHRVIEHNVS